MKAKVKDAALGMQIDLGGKILVKEPVALHVIALAVMGLPFVPCPLTLNPCA